MLILLGGKSGGHIGDSCGAGFCLAACHKALLNTAKCIGGVGVIGAVVIDDFAIPAHPDD